MHIAMVFLTSVFFFNAMVSYLLSGWTLIARPRSQVVQTFALLGFAIGLWMFGLGMLTLARDPQDAVVWLRIQHAAIILVPAMLVHFVYAFLNKAAEKKIEITVYYIISLVFLALSLCGNACGQFIMSGVKPHYYSKYTSVWGNGYYLYLLYFVAVIMRGFYMMLQAYRRSSGIRKTQLRYIIIAGLCAGFSSSFVLIMIFDIKIFPFGVMFYPLYQLIMLYAILTTRLMEIEVVVKKSLFYSVVTILITGLYLLMLVFLNYVFRNLFDLDSILAMVPVSIIVALAFQPFMDYMQKNVDRNFFRRKYEYEEMLEEATTIMTRLVDLGKVLKLITRNISRRLQLSSVLLYFYEEEENRFYVRACDREGRCFKDDFLSSESPIVKWFRSQGQIIVKEEIELQLERKDLNDVERKNLRALKAEMDRLKSVLCVPGVARERLLGFMLIGEKLSGEAFSTEELNLLSVLADQVALSVENSLFFEQQKKLARKVSEMEAQAEYARMVEKSNEQLEAANEKLISAREELVKTEKLASLTEAAVSLNRELGNPLTTILANIQVVLGRVKNNDIPDPGFIEQNLGAAEKEALRIREIIHNLQALSEPVVSGLMAEEKLAARG